MAGELQPDQIATNTGGIGSIPALVDVDPPSLVPGLPALDARLLFNLPNTPGAGETFDAYDGAGGTLFNSSTWVDLPLSAQVINTGAFNFTPGTAAVEVTVSGMTWLAYSLSFEQISGNNRTIPRTRLVRDTGSGFVEVPGWQGYEYSRRNADGEGTVGKARALLVSAGDILKIQVQRFSGPGTLRALAGGSHLSIAFTTGQKGDKGDTGSGSTINARNNGTPVTGTPFDDIDFGTGLNATPSGTPGRLLVEATPVPPAINAFGRNEAGASRTQTSYDDVLTLPFTTTVANEQVDVDWQAEHRNDDAAVAVRIQVEVAGQQIADMGDDSEDNGSEWNLSSGFDRVTVLTPGNYNLIVRYSSEEGGKRARIRAIRAKVKSA